RLRREELRALVAVAVPDRGQRGVELLDPLCVDDPGLALHPARISERRADESVSVADLLREGGGLQKRLAESGIAGLALGLAAPDQQLAAFSIARLPALRQQI